MKNNSSKPTTFVIAEAGVNHNGSFKLAKQLIDLAADSGADAVKFQTFHVEDLVSASAPKALYQKITTSIEESQYDMLKQLQLSEKEQIALYDYCQERRVIFLSSPFDFRSVDFLTHELNLPYIKIASGEITNIPLLIKIAKTRKEIILSTGMSSLGEIEVALGALAFGYLHQSKEIYPSAHLCEEAYYSIQGQEILQKKVSLLHCTSDYPALFEEVNLRAIDTLHQAFGLRIGYSDHTPGIVVSIAAVACGAQIIEKHFTLDKSLSGPDHQASLDPQELKAMITGIRQVELALGKSKKIPTKSELKTKLVARKSLVALKKISKGETFTQDNLGCKRPGDGISPKYFSSVLNKCAERDYEKDELIGV